MAYSEKSRLVKYLRQELESLATAGMRTPKKDPFEHGTMCGQYAALEKVLNSIPDIFRDDEDAET